MALLDSARGGLSPKNWTRKHNPGYAYVDESWKYSVLTRLTCVHTEK